MDTLTPDLNRIYVGDCLEIMRSWPDAFVQTVVTSPPYWRLRDYGVAGQLGLEKTVDEFVVKMVKIFREVRRVLRDNGTLWLNFGDSYTSGGRSTHGTRIGYKQESNGGSMSVQHSRPELPDGLKPKDLVGMPWRVAFALQADGWYLRSDIIWAKPNPMPESVTDRPTKAHEYLFLMTKSERYFYDAAAIKEPASFFGASGVDESGYKDAGNYNGKNSYKIPACWMTGKGSHTSLKGHHTERNKATEAERKRKELSETQVNLGRHRDKQRGHGRRHEGFNDRWDDMERQEQCQGMRNKRSVWTIATSPFPEAHFATFPPGLIKPCILAGSMGGGIVLDPFMGAGTTALVALQYNRQFLGIELNPAYVEIAERRIAAERAQVKMAI